MYSVDRRRGAGGWREGEREREGEEGERERGKERGKEREREREREREKRKVRVVSFPRLHPAFSTYTRKTGEPGISSHMRKL